MWKREADIITKMMMTENIWVFYFKTLMLGYTEKQAATRDVL